MQISTCTCICPLFHWYMYMYFCIINVCLWRGDFVSISEVVWYSLILLCFMYILEFILIILVSFPLKTILQVEDDERREDMLARLNTAIKLLSIPPPLVREPSSYIIMYVITINTIHYTVIIFYFVHKIFHVKNFSVE